MNLPHDPRWPRASHWLEHSTSSANDAELIVMGVPAHTTSISPTNAHQTPAAIRNALSRYSTHHLSRDVDIAELKVFDAGDVIEPDGFDGELRVADAIRSLNLSDKLLCALGGDNSITYSVMHGIYGDDISSAGLITLDAHYDLRDGMSNGSPVQRLVEAGLSGANIVQIGIADFSNSPEYAKRARDYGITVIARDVLRRRPLEDVMAEALEIAGTGTRGIYVDIDVDVCDRSVVPACPAAAPGGISADELRQICGIVGADKRVQAIDFTEIDASIDTADQRTVRLAALCVLEAAAGRLSIH
ncbi:MAG: hypothetical protein RIS75_813 [Actinomycetota bacterium]